MEALKIAVVGAGNIAQKHLEVLSDLPGVELTFLVDADKGVLNETGDRFGISGRRTDYRELLENEAARPDAVFVLVSVLAVADVASEFIRAKIPSFIEKPPGLHAHQTRKMAELAEERGTLAMVGVNRRFYSTHIAGRERLLEKGPIRSVSVEAHEDIGRVRVNPKFPEEVMRHWSAANGIHALDMLRFFGGDVSGISSAQHTVQGPMPDCCAAILEFENGALGRALLDYIAPGGHRVEARSEGATFLSDFRREAQIRYSDGSSVTLEFDKWDEKYKPGFYGQAAAFATAVREGTPLSFPACTLQDALKSMEMVEAIAGTGGAGQ